jgi:hypothetical protein
MTNNKIMLNLCYITVGRPMNKHIFDQNFGDPVGMDSVQKFMIRGDHSANFV